MKRACAWLLVLSLWLMPGRAVAQESDLVAQQATPSEDKAPLERLVLHAAAEPKPALQYQLLPPLLDRKPGNAAVTYNKTGMRFSGEKFDELQQKLADWAETPLDKLPRDEIRQTLERWQSVIDDLHRAARRSEVDWQLPLGEQEFFSMLLNEAQKTREFARLLVVQARLQIAEGQFEQAVATLQTTYAMARHVGRGETLISNLVGMAICSMASAQLREMVQQPDAPNMYWALTALPRPMIDMRPAVEAEMNSLYFTYPALKELRKDEHSPAYWEAFTEKLVNDLGKWSGGNEPAWQGRLALTAMALKGYPLAKAYLIERGRTPQQVDAMPVPQVVALYTMQVYDELRDEVFKWMFVPYVEARAGMQAAESVLKQARHREVVPVAQLLLPSVANVKLAEARTERTFAMLRVIEALRLHAAAHEGRLPQRLADITLVPVPSDPVTGGPFVYTSTGSTAVLEAPLPPELSPRANGARFEIRMERR
jgi:hypothetical protein